MGLSRMRRTLECMGYSCLNQLPGHKKRTSPRSRSSRVRLPPLAKFLREAAGSSNMEVPVFVMDEARFGQQGTGLGRVGVRSRRAATGIAGSR
jgi:hypothetical protein